MPPITVRGTTDRTSPSFNNTDDGVALWQMLDQGDVRLLLLKIKYIPQEKCAESGEIINFASNVCKICFNNKDLNDYG